ncbi:MAG TPA: TadE/TadG family type IV pilus assembly protein [Roseiarcus sp.]|jgi:Flp pilus assembly protein TadG|nr:TadE/TadG family type IV pilus assembly protein [Roseiarcus sp.]
MIAAASVLKRFARDRNGLAAIELAIIAPVLLLCVLCVTDLGRFAFDKTWVAYAASAGTAYAAAHADDHQYAPPYPMASAFSAAVSTAASSATPAANISISPTPSSYYGCATATGVTASTQGATCPSGTSTGATAGTYVSVTATMPFTALFSAAGISYPSTITSTAVVRIE